MNWADILVLSTIGLSTLVSLYRGFVREALSILAWFVAFWCAFSFSGTFAEILEPYVINDKLRIVLAFIGISLSILMVSGFLNHMVGKLIKRTHFSGTDRVLGFIFGFVRGGAIAVLFVLIAGLTSMPERDWWREAQALETLERAAIYIVGFAPPELGRYFSY